MQLCETALVSHRIACVEAVGTGPEVRLTLPYAQPRPPGSRVKRKLTRRRRQGLTDEHSGKADTRALHRGAGALKPFARTFMTEVDSYPLKRLSEASWTAVHSAAPQTEVSMAAWPPAMTTYGSLCTCAMTKGY